MDILHIDSSALGGHSASRELSAAMVNHLRRLHPGARVSYRDLDSAPLPHLSAHTLSATDASQVAEADTVMRQFLQADVVVIGVPVYNFSVSSALKAWIDRIAVAGKTFRYTAEGPQGLAGDKSVWLAVTRGGVRGEDDFEEAYLRHMLGFLGIDDIQSVRAEGLALSPAHRDTAMTAAKRQIGALTIATGASREAA